MKKFRNLDKPWKEILYAAAGFGPNLLMVLMGCFFTDAVNPSALNLANNSSAIYQTITGAALIVPGLFSILWFIAKAFDGVIDVPFASLTDNFKSKWGRRRPLIAICFIPMVISYAMCWWPVFGDNQLANTIWIVCWALVFFATYTMNLIAYYGSLSTVCADEKQRLKVSSLKSFFDTISYAIVYALVPLILGAAKIRIDTLVFMLLPLMLTMIIPLFMIKEGNKFEAKAKEEGYDITPLAEEPRVSFKESFVTTFKNKPFMRWVIVNCCSFFGLQMFLVSMNALILGGMGLTGTQMAILNTCAFAPVPLMLYLFKKLKAKKGIRFAYQSCLLCFAICILSFVLGSTLVMKDNVTLKMIIGIVGGLVGSWAIGSFFMMPYLIPSQISSVEEKLTGKNHSAMYFAAQALTTSVIGAVASSLVYENIKNIFFTTDGFKFTRAVDKLVEGTPVYAADTAALNLGVDVSTVYNFGTLLVPIIVSIFCILGFILAFKMPKNYTPRLVAKELGMEREYEERKAEFEPENDVLYESESLIINNGLWVLTGMIFGFFWLNNLINCNNLLGKKKVSKWWILISILIPPLMAIPLVKLNKNAKEECDALGMNTKGLDVLVIIFSVLCLNLVSLSIVQHKLNKVASTFKVEEPSVKPIEE